LLSQSPPPQQSPLPKVGAEGTEYGVARIAFGTIVFFSDCKIALNNEGMLALSFKETQRDSARKTRGAQRNNMIKFDLLSELRDVKYYIRYTGDSEEASAKEVTESPSFIAMKVVVPETRESWYPKNYQAEETVFSKRYILVEFHSNMDLIALLGIMQTINSRSQYMDERPKLTMQDAASYCESLEMDSQIEKIMRKKKRKGLFLGKENHYKILAYPFDGDKELIEKTAERLLEASKGSGSETVVGKDMEFVNDDPGMGDTGKVIATSGGSDKGEQKKGGHAHFLVTVEDYERLEPGVYLNDTLVNFWMKWYVPTAHSREC
jgi:hypothetical protein